MIAAFTDDRAYRPTIWGIALGILAFAALQSAYALQIGNRQLLKDGLDWGYDVVLYAIAALVFGRGQKVEEASALLIGAISAFAGFHTLYDLWDKIVKPRPIELTTLGFSAISAVVIGLVVVAVLARFRRSENALVLATWLSARNALIGTGAFAALAFVTRAAPVRWPEYTLDVFLAGLNFQAAWAIWRATGKGAAVKTELAQPGRANETA
jgi:Co/Zn/Cd efflux system component